MRVVANLVLAVYAAALVGGVLIAGSWFTPYMWMPVAYAFVLAAWFGVLPTIRDNKLGLPIGAFLATVATAIWIRSEGLLTVGPHARTPRRWLLAWFIVLGVAAAGFLFVWFSRLKEQKSKVVWLLIVIALATLIAQTSNGAAGAGGMVDWAMAHFHWDRETAERIVIDFRKTIHFSFYGFVAFAAWKGAQQALAKRPAALAFAFGTALIMACFDELRQSTQVGRSGSIFDVLLDLCGVLAVLAIAHFASTSAGPSRTLANSAK